MAHEIPDGVSERRVCSVLAVPGSAVRPGANPTPATARG